MTEQPPPKTFPNIQGRCPACRGDSLFVGSGGWITCSRIDCPNPSAADQMLHGELQIPRPAGTEGTEERNLVHALGGDRTAKTIAHTLTVHGHTLDAVRTMTYAELLAVPGIGGPSLARIRAALDGWPEPNGTDQAEIGDIQITRKLGHGLIVDTAPPRTRMALAVLADSKWGAALQGPDRINIGEQVLYRVTGYDPEPAALLLELVEDWRPVPTATLAEADRVRALHKRNENTGECEYCSARDYPTYAVPFPCDTIRALDGEEQPGA